MSVMPLPAGNALPDEKLSLKQHKALTTLLTAGTIAEAAAEAGVHERTLRKWLTEDEAFQGAYRRLRSASFEAVVGLLQSRVEKALKALDKALECGQHSTELRAAIAVLQMASQNHERNDLYQQIKEFDQTMRMHMGAEDAWGQRNYG